MKLISSKTEEQAGQTKSKDFFGLYSSVEQHILIKQDRVQCVTGKNDYNLRQNIPEKGHTRKLFIRSL